MEPGSNPTQPEKLKDLFRDLHFWCAGRDLNPHAVVGQGILSPSCLPIPPPAQKNNYGGTDEICTRVRGFADHCLTPRPPRHHRLIIPDAISKDDDFPLLHSQLRATE